MKSYYLQLKPLVLPNLECYQNDFLKHDRRALRKFDGEFLFGLRSTGTNLLKFGGGEDPLTPKFQEIVEYFLFRANQRFFHGVNGKVQEIIEEKARSLYERTVKKGATIYA